ncbi:hypothetical protein ACFX2I_029914 [Malus domestica]
MRTRMEPTAPGQVGLRSRHRLLPPQHLAPSTSSFPASSSGLLISTATCHSRKPPPPSLASQTSTTAVKRLAGREARSTVFSILLAPLPANSSTHHPNLYIKRYN